MTFLVKHISIRVPWHDKGWIGCVCERPNENPYCTTLPRIREKRDEPGEKGVAV